MPVKFSEQEGCILNSNGDTITFNQFSPLQIRVPYAPEDVATLGSFLRVSFANTVGSSAPSVHTSTTQSYAGITLRRPRDIPRWTRYCEPVIPNTVNYGQQGSAGNVSTATTRATATTTTCSSVPLTVQQNITPTVLNPANFPHLPGAQMLTTTTTSFSTPISPPVLTGPF